MKKRSIYNPIIKILQFIGVVLAVAFLISFFCALAEWSSRKTKAQSSISDNIELNNTEQYHLSQGHNIKFVEDIFGY